MSDLKAGDATTITVGDKTLTIEAVPYGQMKNILRMVFDIAKEVNLKKASSEDVLTALMPIVEKYVDTLLPLLFRKGTHDFLTPDWMSDNLSIPQIRVIVEAAIKVNGLQDFFGSGVKVLGPNGSPQTLATPRESSGSITSLDSPTVGVPVTLTN